MNVKWRFASRKLVMGAFAAAALAVIPATANAAGTVTPAPITGSIGVSVGNGTTTVAGTTTGGTLVINVDGGNVTLNGSTGTASGDSFNPVSGNPSPLLPFPTLVPGTVTSSDLTFTSSLGGGTCNTADIVAGTTSLKVNADSTDTVSTTCLVAGTTYVLTLVVSANGVPVTTTATPELSPTELVATGFVVAPLLYLVRRRRRRQQR